MIFNPIVSGGGGNAGVAQITVSNNGGDPGIELFVACLDESGNPITKRVLNGQTQELAVPIGSVISAYLNVMGESYRAKWSASGFSFFQYDFQMAAVVAGSGTITAY